MFKKKYLLMFTILIILITVMLFISFNKKENYCYNDVSPLDIISVQEPVNLYTSSSICKMFKDISDYYGKTDDYLIDTESQYYKDIQTVINKAKDKILETLKSNKIDDCTPLIMSDLDDTVWCTYNELKNSDFCYDFHIFNIYASKKKLPAIFPSLELLHFCVLNGIIPVFVTGRVATESQKNITLSQLQDLALLPGRDYWGGQFGWDNISASDVTGPMNSGIKSIDGIFMHDVTKPVLQATEFKSNTRKFIEENGLPGIGKVKFIASMGDQWSDSNGGYNGGIQIKLPNPMYFLP